MGYIIRLQRGKSHIYINEKGGTAKKEDIEYAKSLVIPPGYPFSMIFKKAKRNVLAVSYDDKGRKQYKYTQEFMRRNALKKYKNLGIFVEHVDTIQRRSKRDLKKGNENALIVRILLECYLRIGSKNGVQNYDHYGISTLKKKHIRFGLDNGTPVCYLSFIGKKGIKNETTLKEKNVVSVLKDIYLQKKKNEFLFENATAMSVNTYLQDIYPLLSSKMIRTYGANILLLKSLKNIDEKQPIPSERQKKILLNSHIETVACKLQNTKTILKGSYIIPGIVESFMKNHEGFLVKLKKESLHNIILSL